MQSAILQVQGDCEKLNITTSNLIEDHRQKQKDIEVSSRGAPGVERRLTHPCHSARPTHPCHSALPTLPFLCPVGLQVLYQGIERLEKEKADREHLEMEIDVVSLWLVPSQRGGMEVEELGWGRQGCKGSRQHGDRPLEEPSQPMLVSLAESGQERSGIQSEPDPV